MTKATKTTGTKMPPLSLDFQKPTWTLEERSEMMRWYEIFHGTGDGQLSRFVPFEIEHNPAGFKQFRRHATKLHSGARKLESPNWIEGPYRGAVLIHLYAAIGNGPGCLYEIIGFRMLGLTKRQIQDTLAFAFLTAGPYRTNQIVDSVTAYLNAWQEDDTPAPFPPGWKVDRDLFRSNIGLEDGFSKSDISALSSWHEKMAGQVPRHVKLWAELHPEAFKTQRLRFEASIGETLPAQIYPLMLLQYATYMARPPAVARSLRWAQSLGVLREYVVSAMELGFVYGGEHLMEVVLTEEVDTILRNWTPTAI